MKLLKLSSLLMGLIVAFSSCCSTKHATSRSSAIRQVYRELKAALPEAEVTVTRRHGVKVVYPEIAMFDFGKDEIKPEARPAFRQFALIVKDYPDMDIVIKGYTDNIGTEEANLSLSDRRALSGKAILAENGVRASRITTRGYGAERPVMSNTTAEGRQANRRVEFLIYDRH